MYLTDALLDHGRVCRTSLRGHVPPVLNALYPVSSNVASVNLTLGMHDVQAWKGRDAETPHERVIQEQFVPRLQAAVQALQMAPDAPEATKDTSAAFAPKLAALEGIAADLRLLIPGPSIQLADFAPSLCSLPVDASLPAPGGHSTLSAIVVHSTV